MTDALRIASYNIRAGLGTDLRRDAGRVLDRIAGLAPDLIALQEADFRLGPRPAALAPALIRERTGLVPLAVGQGGPSIGWHGNAILARPGLHLGRVERIDLPGVEPRGAVIADIEGGFPLRLVAVHLGLLRHSRRRQIDHIRAALERLPRRPTVILGDFNEWSRMRGLGRMARHFTLVTPAATFPARRAVAALDRMAHSGDLELRLVPVDRGRGHQPSDHLPILAEARLAARDAA
ncbi:MAG: endonuclease/exonuclease/phosphatase family protein [Rubellimicrobium sp.]|nr:endonuclease/exonuclease/phosphatase family protein [Rubellimicrobium sp.]